jgi:GNAT superfamily N-acetyltransferase
MPSLSDRLATGFDCPDKHGTPVVYRYLQNSDDLQALTVLLHHAYAPLAAAGMRFVASFQVVEVTRRRVSAGETIVAVEHDRIIGTITLKPPDATKGSPFYDRPDVASVGQFAVAPEHQHRGIGTLLGGLAEQRAKQLGAQYLALDTSERAAHLIAIYEAHGFEKVENVQWEGLNYRSVVMAKRLTPSWGDQRSTLRTCPL